MVKKLKMSDENLCKAFCMMVDKSGMSRYEIAKIAKKSKKSKISQQNLLRWYHGESSPSGDQLALIAKITKSKIHIHVEIE